MNSIVFIDSEISTDGRRILDLGAVKPDGARFHSPAVRDFMEFVSGCRFICGHNIIEHDFKYLGKYFEDFGSYSLVDTLPLSPLLFPRRPYHRLVKDDKLQSDELNNPFNDSIKAMELFNDEINAFKALPFGIRRIYCGLLYNSEQFRGFFDYNGYKPYPVSEELIKKEFEGRLCQNAGLEAFIKKRPVELAYALALIGSGDNYSVTPKWVLKNYPHVENIVYVLCGSPCEEGCAYCAERLNVRKGLKRIFDYDNFRSYNGEPLQERAAQAAVNGGSLLAVFPTGGGKSVTFQLPALLAGEAVHGLTVVISPLQSLMKDQVDNLEKLGIADAVTLNGLLSPIERAEAIERVAQGTASLLYISPEQLRSKTVETLLLSRNIVRFVIDEAHCFSAWGQDFRVDYLYIGDFIRTLSEKKQMSRPVPVSCFTATAKQKVIADIRDYFKKKLGLELELFATSATRENLRYVVLHMETDTDKYNTLRTLIEQKNRPAIVYVSSVRRTHELAERLTGDGFEARPFNGKMEPGEKIANQEAFIRNEVRVIVATSAFGMGVDKKDVGLVVHYDISDSLENYVQEAGRAGRDPSLQAECYVLYNDDDLDKHFIMLNQTRLSINQIQQVWKAVKDLTRMRPSVCCSALEIARQAGWDDPPGGDVETRVKTAVAALESAGYVRRGRNVPHVYATSIMAKNMQEARQIIEKSPLFDEGQRDNALRIIKSLISERSVAKAGNDDAESRVDYLADILGISKEGVIEAVGLMRQEGLLEDHSDMSAHIRSTDSRNKSSQILERFARLEGFMLDLLKRGELKYGVKEQKELNEKAIASGVPHSSVRSIRSVLYYWTIKNYIHKPIPLEDRSAEIISAADVERLRVKFDRRIDICRFAVEELFRLAEVQPDKNQEERPVEFSLIGLWRAYCDRPRLDFSGENPSPKDVEDALLYLSKIGSITLEGGFLVLYNGMEIKRLISNNNIRYKNEDYRTLNEFYRQKIQQIHIVGEYANLMVRDYSAALQFVQDYFQMEYRQFISKYFKGERLREIERNITPEKYRKYFGELSEKQKEIINDDKSKYIVVAAGPGSGKTKVLVHKLASLLQMEDVKQEQLLMLTFSRAAATEFKKRLTELIGPSAHYVEIKTFHSYCFDLLGRIGNLEGARDVVKNAAEMINSGEVELGRITKTVVVIDEAQDMDGNEFALIEALMARNDDMRVIAVGDDDQNIYEFRGSDSKYLRSFIAKYGAKIYEMTENYRSAPNIIAISNALAARISDRMKRIPCRAAKADKGVIKSNEGGGIVRLTKHAGENLEEPIVREIREMQAARRGARVCVLTSTNDEALRVLGLLNRYRIRAKLIQSNDGFSLYNLAELRFFLKIIDRSTPSSKIPDGVWEEAKKRLYKAYKDSLCLEICRNLILDFEAVCRDKYRSDLEEFIRESKYEDFCRGGLEAVTVSTMHKSKGREFDVVYMLMNGVKLDSDERKRLIYVGMTRAKKELYIHYSGNSFDGFNIPGIDYRYDRNQYAEPEEIMLQLTHHDVALGFFKDKKERIIRFQSGRPLYVDGDYMTADTDAGRRRVLKLSQDCKKRIEGLKEKGYMPYRAVVRFVVAWKGAEDDAESAVLLPELYLKR